MILKTGVLVRLSIVNAVGFSASTIMPLWLGGVAHEFGMPAWFAGVAVLAQLGGAAIFNLMCPFLFRKTPLLPLARVALVIAGAIYLLALTRSPWLFIVACLVCGSALGIVLNATNRLMGSADHVQKGYAIFVLIEVCFGSLLFLSGATLIGRFGLLAVFPLISVAALLALVLLSRLPIDGSTPMRAERNEKLPNRGRAILALAGFALFFVGQGAVNGFLPTIGQTAGMDAQRASQVMGLALPFAFIGAILTRVIGERLRPLLAVSVVVIVLAASGSTLILAPTFTTFVATVVVFGVATVFAVPYFFAHFGELDHAGRYAACGPAMILTGNAIGPGVAVLLSSEFGLRAVGGFSCALLVLGGLSFALSTCPVRQPMNARRGAPGTEASL